MDTITLSPEPVSFTNCRLQLFEINPEIEFSAAQKRKKYFKNIEEN